MIAPLVFAAVRKRKLKTTVAEALAGNTWVCHLAGSFDLPALPHIVLSVVRYARWGAALQSTRYVYVAAMG